MLCLVSGMLLCGWLLVAAFGFEITYMLNLQGRCLVGRHCMLHQGGITHLNIVLSLYFFQRQANFLFKQCGEVTFLIDLR